MSQLGKSSITLPEALAWLLLILLLCAYALYLNFRPEEITPVASLENAMSVEGRYIQ